jgi:hypothetical protein|tara:strand:- start:79 stop:276 length:198 start_codon:yes stop_codon:yes gene_type:complete
MTVAADVVYRAVELLLEFNALSKHYVCLGWHGKLIPVEYEVNLWGCWWLVVEERVSEREKKWMDG